MKPQRAEGAAMEDAWARQNLAQFEPDPEGFDARVAPASTAGTDPGDASWIVWPSLADESAWAGNELELEWLAAAGLAGKGLQAR